MPRGRKPDEEAYQPPRDMEAGMFLDKKIFVVTLAPAVSAVEGGREFWLKPPGIDGS